MKISQDDLNLIPGGSAVRLYYRGMPGGMKRSFSMSGLFL